MADDQQKPEDGSLISNLLKHWAPPALTATLSLIAGIWLAVFNSDIATNRFYLEKQATTADNVATQFSRYIENWARLVILRKEFDRMNSDPSPEQREYFKTIVFERADARDKLFSSLDSVHLYYSNKTSDLIVKFREWDNSQAELTVDKLPEIKEWRNWQIKILHKLREEIKK
jgi:hypothetical protein